MLKTLQLLAYGIAWGAALAGEGKSDGTLQPGESLGQVRLGMSHEAVLKLLGTPQRQEDLEFITAQDRGAAGEAEASPKSRLYDGVVREDWISSRPVPTEATRKAGDWAVMADYLTVYFRAGKVCQIEANSPKFITLDGLSVKDKAAAFERRYPGFAQTALQSRHPSAGGIPATKRLANYEDAIADGLSWRDARYGNLAPDFDPQAESPDLLIVHPRGVPVLPDPDLGSRFAWKAYPFPNP